MKSAALSGALALLFAGTRPEAPDALRFAPDEELSLRREVTTTTEFEHESTTFYVDGEEVPERNEPELRFAGETRIVVSDVLEKVGDGRPLELERTFEVVRGTKEVDFRPPGGEPQASEQDLSSGLEGRIVRFAWDPRSETYDAELADDGEDDSSLLEGLHVDMDLLDLLPKDEADVGDSWELDSDALRHALWPGGAHKLITDEEDPVEALDRSLQQLANFEADALATYEERRTEGDVEVAVLSFEIEGTTHAEIEPNRTVLSYELEGELLWGLDSGHPYEWSLEGDLQLELHTSWNADGPDGPRPAKRVRRLTGTLTQTMSVAQE